MQLATQPRPILGLIADSYRFFWPVFKKVLPIMLIFIVVVMAFSALSVLSLIAAGGLGGQLTSVIIVVSVAAGIWLVSFFYGTQLIRGYGLISHDEKFLKGASWRLAGQRTWRGIGGTLAICFILFGVSIAISLVGMALAWVLIGLKVSEPGALYYGGAAIAYTVFETVVMMYCFLRFALAWPEIFIRGHSVVGALVESLRLSKGECLRLLAGWIGAMLIPMIITGLLFFFGGAEQLALAVTPTTPEQAIGVLSQSTGIISTLIGFVLHIFVVPVLAINIVVLLLNDLELRKNRTQASA